MTKLIRWVLPFYCCMVLLTGCDLPRVSPEARIFLNLSLDYLGEYQLPQAEFESTILGGISAITYDRNRDRIYALSDDRAQPRYYTLNLKLHKTNLQQPTIKTVSIESVTFLQDQNALPYPSDQLDPEGIALTPQGNLWISSEGFAAQQSPPALIGFDPQGQWQQQLPLPKHVLATPATEDNRNPEPQGIADNRGFEALTLSPEGDRVFTALESPLQQDYPDSSSERDNYYTRFLHYWIGEPQPQLLAEYLYPIQPANLLTGINGLTELLSLDSGGHFLTLERSYSPLTQFNAKLFQISTAMATDTSTLDRLPPVLNRIIPIQKQPLLDFKQLPITISNLEGMTWGPMLADGSPSLVVVSDNNFDASISTQFLLFRLRQNRQRVS